ncbi:MFS transporter [Nonomuraea antimicrobica]|uniref:MFS transporter n=1 Tax=Nonomuraea antimicrobica TaxID=561173 RepID=A0ABP7EC32_9ACTN
MPLFKISADANAGVTPQDPARTSQVRTVALSGYLGSTIEFYDFLLYGTSAALVFDVLFFPDLDPVAGNLAALGTFAAGYLARPLGGVIFGHFGDKLGRKSMLLLTMGIMGTASFLIGVLPTYSQIGIWAPALLVLLRLAQGVAIGGEWGGAALMTAEHSQPLRRGFWASLTQMGGASGTLLSSGAIAVFSSLPEDQFLSWGWRVPFLLSIALLGVGLLVRLKVAESPVFARAKRAGDIARSPVAEVLRRHPLNLLRALSIGFGAFVANTLLTAFVTSYGKSIGYSATETLTAVATAAGLSLITIPAFAALSDRVGRRPVILGGAVGMVVAAFPLFWLINANDAGLLTLAVILGNTLLFPAMYAPLAACFAEMFGTGARYTGASLGYQLASTLGAGFAPLIAGSLLSGGGGGENTTWVSIFLAGAAAITAVAMWATPETRGHDLHTM